MKNNTAYLSSSIEAARLSAAEKQMEPASDTRYPFEVEPLDKCFKVYLAPPLFFTAVPCDFMAREWKLKYLRSLSPIGENYYLIRAVPWASSEQIAGELKDLLLPF